MTKTVSSSSICGTNVKNAKGESLGEIKDLMINTNKNEVAYAVLSFGGFMGFGDKYFAIPFEALSYDDETNQYLLSVAQEKLEQAPGFDKNDWPTHANIDYLSRVYTHYNVRPYWK